MGYKFYSTLKGESSNQDILHMIDDGASNDSAMKRQDEIKKELGSNKVGSGNYYLKYHMIRKILEQKDTKELQKYSANNNSQGKSSLGGLEMKNEIQTSRNHPIGTESQEQSKSNIVNGTAESSIDS